MVSCVYEGQVQHRRFQPVEHRFRVPLFFLYLDLAELPEALDPWPLWSARRPTLAWFRRADHLGPPDQPLAEAVRDLVAERTGARPAGPLRLLTHLRYGGHCFNPVSFYYCWDRDGRALEAVVAEVENTPWHERHCYVLPRAAAEVAGDHLRWRFAKVFHVSPFMPMDLDYDWTFNAPGERLGLHFELTRSGQRWFDATLTLARRPLDGRTLYGCLLRYPLLTLSVVARIHLHAARLWLKGVPFYVHPKKVAGRPSAGEPAP